MRVLRRLLVLLLAASGPARAHEFWIEPSRYEPSPGELVKLRLLVGQDLVGEGVPRNDVWIERFDMVSGGTTSHVVGLDGSDPAGLLRPEHGGPVVVAYASLPSYIEIDPEKFEAYLASEGLDAARKAREKEGARGKRGRERFSRCAKTLLWVGGRGDLAGTAPVGLALEIVPESASGSTMTFRVLDHGKPLRGVLVKARDGGSARDPLQGRTDGNGRIALTLPRPGSWMINAVHMVPVRDDPRADWESFWASLTFDLPAPG
ncbi:MAG TPA: DUF4198 domain-containing protein [Candidatus Polarisedimenticolaceae bacterium]|nr:DUF4198 domain-containing protein [Candidatus Polarisedimenticolaceae bacterium]